MHISPYKAPSWGIDPAERARLRDLVHEALPAFDIDFVTHMRAEDFLQDAQRGYATGEHYRKQLELFGEIEPGEALNDMAFASIELRRKGDPEWPIGIRRYGDVVVHWKPDIWNRATIAPILSGSEEQAEMFGGGLHAGSIADIEDVLTDTLLMQGGRLQNLPMPKEPLTAALALPHDQAVQAVGELLIGPEFHRISPEAIMRGASADAIAGVTMLHQPPAPFGQIWADPSSPEAASGLRGWAEQHGIELRDRD